MREFNTEINAINPTSPDGRKIASKLFLDGYFYLIHYKNVMFEQGNGNATSAIISLSAQPFPACAGAFRMDFFPRNGMAGLVPGSPRRTKLDQGPR